MESLAGTEDLFIDQFIPRSLREVQNGRDFHEDQVHLYPGVWLVDSLSEAGPTEAGQCRSTCCRWPLNGMPGAIIRIHVVEKILDPVTVPSKIGDKVAN